MFKKILGAVPGDQREKLSEIWGEELLSLESENTSDFERQNTIRKAMNSTPAMQENDVTHEKMMEFEPLLEISGERSHRGVNLTHGECPCFCLAQTVWYPEHSGRGRMGRGRNSVNRVTRLSAEGHTFRGELDAGVAVDRGKCDEISSVGGTNSGINTCY